MDVEATIGCMTALLEAHQVAVSVDSEVLLAPVSAQVNAGQVLAVLGQNGSGKTTLLRILAGLLRPTSGTVAIENKPLDERRRDTRRAISSLIGLPAFATDLTVREQLRFIATTWGMIGTVADDRADSTLQQWGISALSHRFAHELSSGQTQLFALSTAFIRPFQVLILDEPEQRLDEDRLGLVIEAIQTAATNGAAVIIATHSSRLADTVANQQLSLGEL